MPLVPPGASVIGFPEDAVCSRRLPPIEFKPPGLAKVASWMVPSCAALVWPGSVADTTPYWEIVMLVAFEGMVIAGRTVSPFVVTSVPWLFGWGLPALVEAMVASEGVTVMTARRGI